MYLQRIIEYVEYTLRASKKPKFLLHSLNPPEIQGDYAKSLILRNRNKLNIDQI